MFDDQIQITVGNLAQLKGVTWARVSEFYPGWSNSSTLNWETPMCFWIWTTGYPVSCFIKAGHVCEHKVKQQLFLASQLEENRSGWDEISMWRCWKSVKVSCCHNQRTLWKPVASSWNMVKCQDSSHFGAVSAGMWTWCGTRPWLWSCSWARSKVSQRFNAPV